MLPEGLAAITLLAQAAEGPQIVLDLPVEIDGIYARDLTVGIAADGTTALLRADRFTAFLEDHLSDAHLASLDLPSGEVFLTTEALTRPGLIVGFDPASLTLSISVPAEGRRMRQISFGGTDEAAPPDALSAPSVSIGVNAFAEPGYQFAGPGTGVRPFEGRLEGFVNAGGREGVTLLSALRYREGSGNPWEVDDLVLLHDRFERAIRLAVGTLRPVAPSTHARAPELIGVGVFHDYPSIRPFANLRPDGGTRFTLDRAATITVEVNGQVAATEDLGPGSYDLSDLPVRPGGNDVVIYADDGTRRTELAVLSTFVDNRLLQGGTTLFSFMAGAERLRGGGLLRAGESLVYAAHVERGVTDGLTLGIGAEGRGEEALITGRAAVGLALGLIAAEGAWRTGAGGTAGAATVRYSWRSDPRAPTGHAIDAQVSLSDEGFVPITSAVTDRFGQPGTPARREASLRYSLRVQGTGLSAGVQSIRTGGRDQLDLTLSATRAFGDYTIGLTGRLRTDEHPTRGDVSDEAILLTVSRRLGRDARARASYDSGAQRAQVQALRFGGQALGDWNADATITTEPSVHRIEAGAGLVTNRAEIAASLRAAEADGTRSGTAQAFLGMGFGYAGGRVAIGRPVDDGFLIAGRHPSLGDREMTLSRGTEPAARAGTLGPALVPLRGSYRVIETEVGVADLPVGYDLGTGTITAFTGARSGYAVTIGSGASNTVMGTLVTPAGEPLALAVGRIVAASAADDEEGAAFFTNTTGRFVAEGLKAGEHEVRLKPDDRLVATVTIPEEADGLVRVGEVRMERP